MRQFIIRFSSILISALIIIGCNSNRSENTLTIPCESDIQTLDPTLLSDPYTSRVVWQIYEGLVGLNEQAMPEPLLAISWNPNSSNTEWSFHLRPNVFFHKSAFFNNPDSTRSVNAEDVLYSYTKHASAFGSFIFSGLVEGFDDYLKKKATDISGFHIKDSMTFVVKLSRPDPSFIYRITSPYLCIIPKGSIEYAKSEFGKTICIGTGIFALDKKEGTQVFLRRNVNYWKKCDGNISAVNFKVEKNEELRKTQLESGSFDIMQLPLSQAPVYLDNQNLKPIWNDKYTYYSSSTFNVHYLGLDVSLVKNIHLRRALAFAVDKNALTQKLLFNLAEPAFSPVPPDMQGYTSPHLCVFNVDSAKAELKKSDYKGQPLQLFTSDAPNSEQIAQILQSDLVKAGINVQLIKLDFNSLIARLFSKNRPQMFLMFSEWIYSAPEIIMDSYNSTKFPNPNLFAYSNKNVDNLLSMIPNLHSRQALNDLCTQVETISLSEVPAVWLYHQKNAYLIRSNITGFRINKHNYWDLKNVMIR